MTPNLLDLQDVVAFVKIISNLQFKTPFAIVFSGFVNVYNCKRLLAYKITILEVCKNA